MISRRLSSAPVSGYYEYLSRVRHRVNVTPYEGGESEASMTQTAPSRASPSVSSTVDNDNIDPVTDSSTAENSSEKPVDLNERTVTQWSSAEVKHWIEEQCQKFELKKATTEKFQMNGQALVLLTKHDFLRRSPDGGEVLYYALRRLINPNKINSSPADQSSTINAFSRRSTRIVEIDSDSDENHTARDSSPSGKPIIEEPDDPPLLRRAQHSEMNSDTHRQQFYPHAFFHHHAHVHPQMYAMSNAAYYHQAFPQAYVYAHHPHVHAHTSQQQQQQFVHPQTHFIHQYYPMMNAHGIVVELLDNDEGNNTTGNGVTSEQLYLMTMNGQRYVMNEEQIRQYIAQIQQQQQQHVHHHQHYHQPQQHTYQPPSQENTFHNS